MEELKRAALFVPLKLFARREKREKTQARVQEPSPK